MPPRSPKRNAAPVLSLIPSQSPTTIPDLTRWATEAARNIRAALLDRRHPDDGELTRLWEELGRLTAALLPAKQSAKFQYDWVEAQGHSLSQRLTLHVLTLLDEVGPPPQPTPDKAGVSEGGSPQAGGPPARVPPATNIAPTSAGPPPAVPAPSPNGTQQGEGEPNNRAKGIPLAEAEILVAEWLLKHAKDDPLSIKRDAVSAGTGVSTGQVSNTRAWKAFDARRKADAKPRAREVSLTDDMLAVVPSDCETPDELAALIEEQRADEAEENRRHKRRHNPS
jgi:hypothetical protein